MINTMFKLWWGTKKDIETVAKRQLKKNKRVIESLRAYDEGKKEISTDKVADRFSHVHTTSQ